MQSFFLLIFILPLLATPEADALTEGNESQNEVSQSERPGENNLECDVPWRLPRNVLPIHYDIVLRIDPEDSVFNGTVSIDLKCEQQTDTVVLHSKELQIVPELISVTTKPGGKPDIVLKNFSVDDPHEMVHIQLEPSLEAGKQYVLTIPDFEGKIHEEDMGLFRRSHVSSADSKIRRNMITSQLQSTFARIVFPCFDEPSLKATYTIHIEHPSQYKSFSSMPLNSSGPGLQGGVLDTFEETGLLPTYAVAVLVGDYSRYSGNGSNRTHILVPGKDLDKVDFAHRIAINALRELESYTKIPYPVTKVDHAAVPSFPSEAMENWGLITYMYEFLVEDENTETLMRQQGLNLIAHELAHQWFGNLVTTNWWSYLWLNEGFATFFQYYISDKILPGWQLWDQFLLYHFQQALDMDANPKLASSAMTSPKCTPAEISDTFNPISYDKGASVLRMFKSILGEEEFQGAIRLYLQRRLMKTAKPADWFQVLEDINAKLNDSPLPKNVSFIDLGVSWTEQAGYPVVTVIRDYTSTSVNLKQERFYDHRSKNESTRKEQRWWIPMTWISASLPRRSSDRPQDWLFEDKNIRVSVPKDDWLLFNINAEGFYRVNYDVKNWNLLAQALERSLEDFSNANRIQLINDVFSLGWAHHLNLGTAMNLTSFLEDEDDAIVWSSAGTQLKFHLYNIISSSPSYSILEKYVQKLVRKAYRRVRLDFKYDEPHMDKILRGNIASVACLYGLDLCLIDAHFAISQFLADAMLEEDSKYRSAIAKVHPDIRQAVMCGGIQSGGKSVFEEMRSLAVLNKIEEDKLHSFLDYLSCSKDFELLTWHLDDIFSNNTMLDERQALAAVEVVIKNQRTLNVGYQYVRNNANKINHYYNCSSNYIEKMVTAISDEIRTLNLYDEVHNWISSSNGDELGNKTQLLVHLESRRAEVEWSDESIRQITDWLNTPAPSLPQPISVSTRVESALKCIPMFLVSLTVALRL